MNFIKIIMLLTLALSFALPLGFTGNADAADAYRRFQQMDRNGDARLSRGEYHSHYGSQMGRFHNYAGNDHMLDYDEWHNSRGNHSRNSHSRGYRRGYHGSMHRGGSHMR